MPPKCKFTKEHIVTAAVDVVRANGATGLTARSLAAQLGASPKPIFGLFTNMEEVQQAVLEAANILYQSYLQQDMAQGVYPPYKASGMAYIRFAREERELFKLLFMRDRTGENIEDGWQDVQPILELIQSQLGLTLQNARLLHLELWMYVHGIASMIATGYLDWDMEFVSRALTDAYQGLKYRHTGK